MNKRSEFAERFRLALDALSISRGSFASELGVDKSLVGRWAAGSCAPTAANKERLTRLLASKRPGFSLLDWELPLSEFARWFVPSRRSAISDPALAMQVSLLNIEVPSTAADKTPYEGFWRTTHASLFERGSFCQQHGIIRLAAGGGLEFEGGADGIRYRGAMFPVAGQLFSIGCDDVRHLPSMMILNVMAVPRIVFMDGLVLTANSPLRTPTSYPVVCERIGDLTGDREVDDAKASELMMRPEALENSGEIPRVIREHLLRGQDGESGTAALGMTAAPHTARLAEMIALSRRSQPDRS